MFKGYINMSSEDDYLKIAAYIKCSDYRVKVVNFLRDHEYGMPRDIAKGIGIRQNHISKVFSELKSKGVIVCLNPEVRKGRIYRLTSEGEKVLEFMDKL